MQFNCKTWLCASAQTNKIPLDKCHKRNKVKCLTCLWSSLINRWSLASTHAFYIFFFSSFYYCIYLILSICCIYNSISISIEIHLLNKISSSIHWCLQCNTTATTITKSKWEERKLYCGAREWDFLLNSISRWLQYMNGEMEFQCNQRLHYFGHRNNNPTKKMEKTLKLHYYLFIWKMTKIYCYMNNTQQ